MREVLCSLARGPALRSGVARVELDGDLLDGAGREEGGLLARVGAVREGRIVDGDEAGDVVLAVVVLDAAEGLVLADAAVARESVLVVD